MIKNRYLDINKKTIELLDGMGLMHTPVDVMEIAHNLGIKVRPGVFEENVSGFLLSENSNNIIGYNQNEPRVRRRFTIAHELGHFVLHKEPEGIKTFVDKGFKVMFRSSSPDSSDARREREANIFAACLLMPEPLVKAKMEFIEWDLGNEDAVKELAKAFDVSTSAMSYRLMELRLIPQE